MKKSLRWSLGLLTVAMTLMLVSPALGAKRHKLPPPPKNEHHPVVYWELESADPSANTIALQKSDSSSNLTLKVSNGTKITVEDKPGKLADLQKGQKITFSASGGTCMLLEASAPDPKDAKKDKSSGKKKKK